MQSLVRDTHFTEIAETKPDSKHRITLGKVPMLARHYRVYANEAGQIILDPQITLPASEAWLFKSKKALRAVLQGFEDAKAGRLVDAPENYSKYLNKA